ncbi:MAG: hypothetical protein A2700_00840 [Candidatus Blackburnbacteria bacterium RIFCSPHIGHO2_01_FULL_44_64]|nr:MAG: hypothetical protein A2700_00840 [Candidatus Blackburnbacteria bacterium RIFCSPHIGHO2_01_FULL_44_64]OGY14980.1 MAG: hypothetical protein A3A62_02350 [Candidatus Blackburnbacteria bacterium RIFCSPLOWO2_01_FULL_44_43]OGY15495.1 MAG: hypothetical protein A3H88_03970 [Candidatus Blackburnbacteria bacterium RIFCSPLOWO2_02_FULL_44_9]
MSGSVAGNGTEKRSVEPLSQRERELLHLAAIQQKQGGLWCKRLVSQMTQGGFAIRRRPRPLLLEETSRA